MRSLTIALLIGLYVQPATAQEKKADVDLMVAKGLEWFKRTQKSDGSWSTNGTYPTTMTALAGMAMLMEGSTLREGKYSDNLVKAVDWFLDRSQKSNGLLGSPNNPTESSRYIYGHGFGMLFLASVYGEEEDAGRRKKLEAVLKKAVEFSCKAVTTKGGWGYVSGKDGGDFDEGSTTITQMQGLRAARNAGIVVPKGTIDNAVKYLEKCTTPRGGVIYNYHPGAAQAGSECIPITAAAVACSFSAGGYDNAYAKKWLKFCKDAIYLKGRINGHDEYQSYYFGQAVYVLGDDRYGKLFPEEKKENWMTWTEYKKNMFEHYRSTQSSEGSWSGGYAGPELATGFALCVLQLEKGTLPIYHR
jgi:hypothetical protein